MQPRAVGRWGGLHTLYSRQTSSGWVQLMDAQQTRLGGGVTSVSVDGLAVGNGTVNGSMSLGSPPAAVPWNGGAQVYYADTHANTLRGAFVSGGQWFPTLMDGGASGNLCTGTPGGAGVQEPAPAPSGFDSMPVSHALGNVLGASVNPAHGPHVFYSDVTTGDMREMFQQ